MTNSKIYLVTTLELNMLSEELLPLNSDQTVTDKCGCNICCICADLGYQETPAEEIRPLLNLLLKLGERFGQWDVGLIKELMENGDALGAD